MLQPLRDLILIQQVKKEIKTDSGIFIPDVVNQHCVEAVVIAVGPGIIKKGKRVKPNVNIGSRVLVTRDAGATTHNKKTGHILIEQKQIIGILT